jgi:hypothetical protein
MNRTSPGTGRTAATVKEGDIVADCERISMCSFFKNSMGDMPVMADIYKKHYCQDKHDACARNKLLSFLEEKKYDISDAVEREIERIAPTLLPNDIEKVNKLQTL